MGYISHHAIIVTSFSSELVTKAHATAVEIGMTVTPVVESPINGYASFMVVPDGSKEGWQPSHQGDSERRQFKLWLDNQRYEDNSTSLNWLEVNYGGDDHGCSITDHAWKHPLGG
jgi:hypothetical protein